MRTALLSAPTHMHYSSEDIDVLVLRAKEGDNDSMGKVIEAFRPYLVKWVNAMSGRWFNTYDREVATVVSNMGYPSIGALSSDMADATRIMDDDDLFNELVVMFIERINRFDHTRGVPFTGYLESTFKHVVYRWMHHKVLHNPPVRPYWNFSSIACRSASSKMGDDQEPVSLPDMTVRERTILQMKFIDGMSTEYIARIYGCTPGRITNIISDLKKRIREHLDH